MSRPLNELKRRLEDESTPLPKRFRLAKNVAFSDHFPTTPKERVIGEWLEELTSNKKITNKDLRDVLSWLDSVDDFTVELKYKLIKIVVQYLNKNIIQDDDIEYITAFMENVKILPQLNVHIEDYLSITMSLLQHLTNTTNILLVDKILNHITKYYKECRKKFEFTIKLLDEENLETIFGFLNTKNETSMLNLCQIVLFPINKRSLFARYLNNFIRKDNANNLSEGRNDNMESVVKVMDAFFTNEHTKNEKFLSDFIKVFVSCFRNESQLLFAFYITVVNCLNMNQTYLTTVTKLTPITFEENDEKIKRNIFYNMLEVLLQNEVDVSVHLRDTLNEKSKETKKVFLLFLQDVMTGTLKMEGKPDKISLNIIQIALKLDPSLIDQKMLQILPPIMISKKGSSISETYSETVNILLQTLFKLSKGIDFIHQMLPHLKNCLEKCDNKQEELKEKLNQSVDDECSDKIWSKIVNGYDILPQNCVEMYGKLTSELMFRQNKDLLLLLQKDLEGCLDDLDDGNCRPSLVTLIEMIAAILSSFLRHNKMADHTVPLPISEDFWTIYQSFEDQCLKKFGERVIKTDCNPLLTSFLKLCLCFAQLKVLNIKYSNTKLVFPEFQHATDVFDIHSVLPCLSETQWKEIARKVNEENAILLDELLLVKTMAQNLLNIKSYRKDIDESISNTKSHLIKHLSSTILLIDHDYLAQVLLTNLDKDQLRQSAKCLIKMYVNSGDMDIFKRDSVVNNKMLLNALVFEVAKNVTKKIENASSLSKNLGKNSFEITSFFKDIDVKEYYSNLTISSENFEDIVTYIEVLKHLQLYYLDENCQLTAIFVLMTLKKCCNSKKTKRSIDYVLQSIFEISPRNPDLFKLFPVNFIFNFESGILELLKLNAKTSNHVSIIKNILETAVKKVKEEPEVVKNMVELLLNNYRKKNIHITSISHFNDEVFQIICIVLPLIAKEKKNITKSAYRSILANLQENLHEAMLDSFKTVNFGESLLNASNTDDSMISENTMATLNAMGAYTLTLSKVCEVGTEIKSMDCLWSGLEFFVQNAIQSIENSETKSLHVDLSMQLLNVILRYIKRLDTHEIFQNRDKLFLQIWRALKSRLFIVLDHRQKRNIVCLDQIAITLKFLAELSSIEFFSNSIIADLNMLYILKKPSILLKNDELKTSQIISRNVLKYLTLNILKANIIEAKCTALEKLIFRSTKNIRFWIQQHYSNGTGNQNGVAKMNVTVEDPICELLKIDLDILADVILAGRKIPLDYKFIDAIFELQQLVHYILGRNTIDTRCEVTWQSFFTLFEGSVTILNSMILSRQELLEDRWPCLMQCYKTLVLCMCERSTSQNDLDRVIEHKFSEIAHSIEKLTQSISKRKAHVSRIAAYAVGDFCSWLEKSPPPKIVRQHLENSIVLLIQASDSNYAMAFLRRGLAGSIGQMTLTNMYTMYKRYHKYVGNA